MNRINDFADSFIPKNLPKKKAKALKEELTCHLLDKADHYKDIGYEESVSITKAIEEFGTDEDMKSYIRKEFEELYYEKTIWGILAGIFIWALNILCLPLDLWVASVDSNRDPDPLGAFMSFLMIFAVVGLIVFARIKKYRKMLFFIGLSNATIVGFFLWCFYPQMVTYSMWYNMIYLIERFTPFIVWNTPAETAMLWIFLVGVPAILALYPFIASLLLKTGKIHDVKNPRRRSIIAACICFSVMFVTCMLQKTGYRYYDDYPIYFTPYDLYISEETEDVYNRISIGDTVEYAESVMDEYAIQSVEKYRGFQDKLGKKQLDHQFEEMEFREDYNIYFSPYRHVKGQGIVGIKSEDGIVTGVAVGNINGYIFSNKHRTFGYMDTGIWKRQEDLNIAKEFVYSLKPGDREEDVVSRFGDDSGLLGEDVGLVYTQRKYLEDGVYKTYYRVYFYGETVRSFKEFEAYYLELYFTEGILEKGALYTKEYTDTEMIPKKIMTIG